jgi:hypothetical protein
LQNVITCPACQHQETEGEFFCSECGARLTSEAPPITLAYDPERLQHPSKPTEPVASIGAETEPPPRHVALHLRGVTIPLLLPLRAEYLLGREGHGEIVPDVNLEQYRGRELGVSRVHAQLRVVHQQVFLTDLGSTNGTRINNTPVPAHKPVRLESGDEIRLGKLYLKIYFNLSTGR